MTAQKSLIFVFTLTLCLLANLVSAASSQTTLPKSVIKLVASREERHHHFLWHNIREGWNKFSSSTQKQIKDLGWAPPRPARRYEDGVAYAITDNNSGEDFLYMHRQMIAKVNKVLSDNKESYGKVTGWTTLPAPGDKTWPVPATYTIPNQSGRTTTVKNWKASSFYTKSILPKEKIFTDPAQLRKMTLGELGAKIEVSVHSWYHLRMSAKSSYGYRPTTSAGLPVIDKKWDDPSYNWLVDTYSSGVNPAFWKIHGWIDDRIEDWRRANGLSSIKWKGTWTGGPMSNIAYLWDRKEVSNSLRGSADSEPKMVEQDVMADLAQILAKEGFEVSFADTVLLDTDLETPTKSKKKLCKANTSRRLKRLNK